MEELKEYRYITAEEEEIDVCVSKDTFKVKKLPDFLLPQPLKRSFDSNLSSGSTFKQSNLCSALPETFLPLHSTTEEQSSSYSCVLFIPHTAEPNEKFQKTDIQEKTMIEALGPEKLLKNKFPMEVGKYQHMMFKRCFQRFLKTRSSF
ncbi:uncharacterized protein LOC136079700 [Hydra vulgaris]|uniref:Uncharacterized protein LOC136079700 n=1 Tax=Hydra vulgaris TaxID=6087 RepID=A0ABM4BS36_HYDVU